MFVTVDDANDSTKTRIIVSPRGLMQIIKPLVSRKPSNADCRKCLQLGDVVEIVLAVRLRPAREWHPLLDKVLGVPAILRVYTVSPYINELYGDSRYRGPPRTTSRPP
jgi:hypothetical protein